MNYSIKTTKTFERNLKRLGKKYRSLKNDYAKFLEELERNPETLGVNLGNGRRKIRMSIVAKGKGKSGGARVIIYTALVHVDEKRVTLLTIYDKSEQESISDSEINEIIMREIDL